MKRMRIFVLLLFQGLLFLPFPVWAGTSLPEQHGCTGCHRFTQAGSEAIQKGPDLFYAGNKFQKPWLEKFLQQPVVIRKSGYSADPGFLKGTPTVAEPHPSLPQNEAGKMADYLMSLTLADLAAVQADETSLTRAEKVRVKILFERDYGCIACHEGINLAGQPRGGVSGPSLADAGNRLNADWVYHWLRTPRKFLSQSRMPLFDLDEETAGKLTQYIMTLKSGDKR